MKRLSILVCSACVVSACGSSSQLNNVQNSKGVQQTEAQVQRQVSKCLPTASGAPDPLLLTRSSERTKFTQCVGVAKHAKAFDACALKVLLGGIPTVARLQKGLTVCVEKAA